MSDTAARAREQRIAEIRERERKATKGPLVAGLDLPFVDNNNPDKRLVWSNSLMVADFRSVWIKQEQSEADAEFYAHARTDIPFLLEQLAAQSALVEEPPPHRSPDRHTAVDVAGEIEWAGSLDAKVATTQSVEEVAREIAGELFRPQDAGIVASILRQHRYGAQPSPEQKYEAYRQNNWDWNLPEWKDSEEKKKEWTTTLLNGAQGQGVGPKMTIGKINVDAFLKVIGIDVSKGDGLGLEWEPRYIATKAFEFFSPVPAPASATPSTEELQMQEKWKKITRPLQEAAQSMEDNARESATKEGK